MRRFSKARAGFRRGCAAVFIFVILCTFALGGLPRETKAAGAVRFELCGGGPRQNCVVDGDTFHMDGVKIRVADIDAPETHPARCEHEAWLGARATHRLLQLLNQGPFELRSWPGRDEDQYGRKLRVVVRNGRSLGDMLVAEGIARTWTGRRLPWCDQDM
ncbi:thermonuclease family protein (plasmid) [Rhizobium sp. CB3060]|uniref:thermonuclease family protein n=1 Tax=Rhizobium sp. CB3060 TaxID=3138255 RepID=UPI0021A5CDCF|nr:thermonuclease family protein [Rhizobium tropici]UWU26004.1 thermonuclease family protein [Rhizobium tropici]